MNVAAGDQNLRRKPHGLREIMSDGGQRRQEQIAEAVTLEAGAFFKAVTEELREQSFIFAEGDDAIANVAGRKHVEFFAQASAGTAVIADGDYGTEVANDGRAGLGHGHFRGSEGEAL